MYKKTTRSIAITVKPFYLEDQSSPSENQYVWAYHVVIENGGAETVQLLNRYWRITDAGGRVQEVRGAGVVGEQPVIKPGESFEYTSASPLATPSGIMVGPTRWRPATASGSMPRSGLLPGLAPSGGQAELIGHNRAGRSPSGKGRDSWQRPLRIGRWTMQAREADKPSRAEAEAAVRTLIRWGRRQS